MNSDDGGGRSIFKIYVRRRRRGHQASPHTVVLHVA